MTPRDAAIRIVAVGKLLRAFDHGDRQYPTKAAHQAMLEAEKAFSDGDYGRADHLARVVAAMVRRDAPKFSANPKAWIEKQQAMGWEGIG